MGASPRICLTAILLILQIYLSAQEKTEIYIRRNISDSISKEADAVCRLDEMEVEIKSPSKIIVRQRHIYTLFNNNADHLAQYQIGYDKLSRINYVTGSLYNASGKELKSFREKDMTDIANDGDAFASDERVKLYRFTNNIYPCTVEFEEEREMAGTYFIPDWYPQRSEKLSLEVSRYRLTAPADYQFRYKMINSEEKPFIIQNKDKITYVWEVRNFPVVPDEPFSVAAEYFEPHMLVGPSDFELEGYKGNVSTWQDYGKFYGSLYAGRDRLPSDLKTQVHALTDHLQDPYKKIQVLYNYLQKNTHYVLIMFGIGGMQPYDAEYVARNKYGDCKALSNFMIALLKEAGIQAYPVTIWGGEDEKEFVVDFPSHQSNHIICAVPMERDTVWLECTSQSLPAGYLGSFTDNRYGLLVNQNGGKLVHTPAYTLKDNTSIRKLTAVMDQEGNLHINSETNYRALSYDRYQRLIYNYSKEEQLNFLKRTLSLSTYTVNSFLYTEDNTSRLPVIHETLDISASNYARVTGKRIFIEPDILRKSSLKFPDENERKLDYQFKNEYHETDSVEISIPSGYITESKPQDLLLETKYGRFQIVVDIQEGRIRYYRYFDRYMGLFPASEFRDIRNFYNEIFEKDHAQIVLVKKPGQ